MAKPDVKTLLEAGVHFGHRTDKWNPKMKSFIYEARNGIHVIHLGMAAEQIEQAMNFLQEQASKGAKVLFVGCKKQAQESVKKIAQSSDSFYVVERWLGGTMTNLPTIRKSVARMEYIDQLEKDGKFKGMPKQEVSALRREAAKLHRYLDGIHTMEKYPDVLVVVDVTREDIAVREAKRLKIPIVALTDTNADPDPIDFPIACNDDAIRSIRVILDYLGDAIKEGKAKFKGQRKNSSASEAQQQNAEKSQEAARNEMEAVSA